MKRLFLSVAMVLCLLTASCDDPSVCETTVSTVPTQVTSVSTEPTIPSTSESTVPATTQPEHSPLYLPDVPLEDVIRYFNEVALNAEYVNSGDPTRLQRWEEPIQYGIYGDPTDQDLVTLSSFIQWLNQLEGFPGIYEAVDPNEETLSIYFCSEAQLIDHLGENFYGADGGVTFWYRDNKIFQGIICCRTDLDQQLRNSVILEELYNGLGPVQDSELREDSIIYSGFSQPQHLTPVDELILKLLYHPLMQCGMDAEECADIISRLYY